MFLKVKLNHYPRLFFLVFSESDNPPDPDVLAQEIVEDLEAALEQFREIAVDLGADVLTEKDQNDR